MLAVNEVIRHCRELINTSLTRDDVVEIIEQYERYLAKQAKVWGSYEK